MQWLQLYVFKCGLLPCSYKVGEDWFPVDKECMCTCVCLSHSSSTSHFTVPSWKKTHYCAERFEQQGFKGPGASPNWIPSPLLYGCLKTWVCCIRLHSTCSHLWAENCWCNPNVFRFCSSTGSWGVAAIRKISALITYACLRLALVLLHMYSSLFAFLFPLLSTRAIPLLSLLAKRLCLHQEGKWRAATVVILWKANKDTFQG